MGNLWSKELNCILWSPISIIFRWLKSNLQSLFGIIISARWSEKEIIFLHKLCYKINIKYKWVINLFEGPSSFIFYIHFITQFVSPSKRLMTHYDRHWICRDVGYVWAGRTIDHPGFGRSVNSTLYQPEGADCASQITTCPPNFRYLPTSLIYI